jgi:hypothetical protein
VFRRSPSKEMWPWRRPGWKSLDLIGLGKEIASVSEGALNLEIWPWGHPSWKRLDLKGLEKEIAAVSEWALNLVI